jgi:hypothetical protein
MAIKTSTPTNLRTSIGRSPGSRARIKVQGRTVP